MSRLSYRAPTCKTKDIPGVPAAVVETSACLPPLRPNAWAAGDERRGYGRLAHALGARALARPVRACSTVYPRRQLLGKEFLPAMARERGKSSAAGRRA